VVQHITSLLSLLFLYTGTVKEQYRDEFGPVPVVKVVGPQPVVDLDNLSQGEICFYQKIIQATVLTPVKKGFCVYTQGLFKPQLIVRGRKIDVLIPFGVEAIPRENVQFSALLIGKAVDAAHRRRNTPGAPFGGFVLGIRRFEPLGLLFLGKSFAVARTPQLIPHILEVRAGGTFHFWERIFFCHYLILLVLFDPDTLR
jgi:hypothetical protein